MASASTVRRDLNVLRKRLDGLVKPYGMSLESSDHKQKILVYQFFQPRLRSKSARNRLIEIEDRCRSFLGVDCVKDCSLTVILRNPEWEEPIISSVELILESGQERRRDTVEALSYNFILKEGVAIRHGDPSSFFPALKLGIELVPQTCWFKSLFRQMPRSRWDKLRKTVCEGAGYVCQVCGAGGTLFCHEIWESDEVRHHQTLTGFHVLCRMCNFVTHIGLAQNLAREGRLDIEEVIQHFMKVNQVDRAVFEAYGIDAFRRWHERSVHSWQTDLGKWNALVSERII